MPTIGCLYTITIRVQIGYFISLKYCVGLIIISSAVTFMIMVAYGVYTLLDIIRGAETFNIYSIIFIFIMLIKVTLCIVSLLRIRAINNAVE